jgi:predicted membrane chloride channel (bestrophin family)
LLGSALGLLLVFRTNTAYNRFWEGRKLWEHVLNNSRDLARFIMLYSESISSAKIERMFHLICAFPLVLQEHVQGFRHPNALVELLTPNDLNAMDKVTNRPYFITNILAKEIRKIEDSPTFSSRERQVMQKFIENLTKSIGSCERIVQTPVPLTYARHTSRFLSLFCFTAPIALVGELGIFIVPFVTMTAWSLFGILEIGMIIEEPFQRALKLEVFANTIRRDISDLLHITSISNRPLNIQSPALGYEVPFFCRIDSIGKLIDDKSLTPEELRKKLLQRSECLDNDPMEIPI